MLNNARLEPPLALMRNAYDRCKEDERSRRMNRKPHIPEKADETCAPGHSVHAVGMSRLLNTAKAAAYLDVEPGTLENWRYKGQGPPCLHLGKSVRYDLKDLDNWIDEKKGVA